MLIPRKIILAAVAVLLIQSSLFSSTDAMAHLHDREFLVEQRSGEQSTYVTYKTDPEHYDVTGNATRTCGPGYNPMNKQHRRNHQYKRSHSHPYVPWRRNCAN